MNATITGEATMEQICERYSRLYGALIFDVLEHMLDGAPLGRIVGPDAMKVGGWQRLNAEYARQFAVDTPDWSSKPNQES